MLEESIARNLDQQIQIGKSKTLEGHKDWVKSVFVRDNQIICGSWDNTIGIWDIDSGACLKILEGHTNYVNSVFVKDNLIISGSLDKTILIWNIDSGSCLKKLKGHTNLN